MNRNGFYTLLQTIFQPVFNKIDDKKLYRNGKELL